MTTAIHLDRPIGPPDRSPTCDPLHEFSEHVARMLYRLDIHNAYGVCGRENISLWTALPKAGTVTHHARHENGAGFAAIGSWMQTGRPAAVFVTTGPGLTNVLTSLESGRATGAKLILLSPLTPAVESGQLGIQDTGYAGCFSADLHLPGRLFDVTALLQTPEQLPALASRLAAGLAGPGAFAAHIAVPTTLQTLKTDMQVSVPAHRRPAPAPSPEVVDEVVDLLAEPHAVWVGWGARNDAPAIRRLLALTGAPVMSSPRGLGIADRHPQFIGVTGNGGHESVAAELDRHGPLRTLVLGTGLGEATSAWDPALVPPKGFIHVDLDPRVFGQAYSQAPTLGIQSGIGELLDAVLARSARLVRRVPLRSRPPRSKLVVVRDARRPIHPTALMAALQNVIVDGTDMPVLADASSAMFWGAHHLEFGGPGRWFTEQRFGSMGFAGAAVVGAAAARSGPALALCGDGSIHMQDEINTAVRYGIHAIWVVLNDSGLGIVRTGMRLNGRPDHDADYPPTDFAAVARAKGATGIRISREQDLGPGLQAATQADGPVLLDVVIDPEAIAPIGARAKR